MWKANELNNWLEKIDWDFETSMVNLNFKNWLETYPFIL